jgi:hypothetical protein
MLLLQSLEVLNQLEALLEQQLGWTRGKQVERIDGSVSAKKRNKNINRFNKAGSTSKVRLCGCCGECGVEDHTTRSRHRYLCVSSTH